MAAAVGSDIDSFIREQKAKLATERQALNQDVHDSRSAVDVGRRHWDKSGGRDATLAVQETRPQTQEGGLPLTNTGSAQKRQALAAQRRQEYNQYLGEKESREGGRRQRRPVTPADAVGLPVGDYQRNRKALDEQRHKEYQEYLQQKQGRQPVDGHVGGGGGSHQHDYKQTSMQLAQQRRQEYNDMLAAKEREPKGVVVEDEITNPSIIPFNRVEEDRIKKRLMEEERHREYQQMKAKLDERHNHGRREASDTGHEGLPVGQYERSRLKEREQQEYREKLEQQVAEKRHLQLQQYDAPTSETAPWKPELDKDFSKPRREATFVKDAQPENDTRDVPRLGLASTSPRQPSQHVRGPVNSHTVLSYLEDDDASYKKLWSKMHSQDYSPWLAGKISNRSGGKYDIEALVQHEVARQDEEEYNKLWERIHGQKKPWRRAEHLSPGRGAKKLNLEALVARAEKRLEWKEYDELWEKIHNKPSPRVHSPTPAPAPRATDTGSYDSRYPGSKPKGAGVDLEATVRRAEKKIEELDYRDLWKEMHGTSQAISAESTDRKPRKMKEDPQSSTNVYEQQKKKLQAERRQEMQTFLQQQKEEHHEQGVRRQWNEPREGKAVPDSEDSREAARKRLADDRKREYQEMRDKSAGRGKLGRREWEIPETASAEHPLQLGQYERTHQQLQKERQEDYNKMLQSQNPGNRSWREPSQEKLLPLGKNEGKRKELEAERNREYNEYLKSKHSSNRTRREPSAENALPLGGYDQKRRVIEEEQKREYQEFLKKSTARDAEKRRMWKETSQEEFLPIGHHEQIKQKLKSERQQEYRKHLRESQDSQHLSNRVWKEPSKEELFPLGRYAETRKLLELERRRDYNDYLRQLSAGRNRVWKEPSKEEFFPLGTYEETRKKLRQERWLEYNEMLKSRDEEESKLRKAFGDNPIPGTWKWDQTFQHRSDHWEKGGGDEFSAKKQIFVDDDAGAISTAQMAGKGDGRSYDWLQPSRPKEQQKKVRISLDEPLFPDGPVKNITSPSVEKKSLPGRQAADGSELYAGSRLGGYEDIHRQLQEERRREYNEMLDRKRQEEPQREFKTPSTDSASGLFSRLGSRESMQSRLREERHREYNEMLERKKQAEVQRERKGPPVGYNAFSGLELRDGNRDRLREERHREYNEMLERKKLAEVQRERNAPPVGSGMFSGLGSREGDRERLREERHQEYKEFLKQNTDRRSLVHQTDEYKASNFPGMNESDNAKLQKERERNNEYNQFLQEKNKGRRARFPEDKDTDSEYFATLPGLRDSHSAKRRQEQQRNREYNQYLASKMLPARDGDGRPPPAPRKGWATPTYEEMLDKKRHQEAQYRRTNDPNYGQALESDRKLSELDKELEAKKARFRNERLSQGVLDDPSWLSPRRGQNDVKYEELLSRLQDFNKTLKHDIEVRRPLPSFYDLSPSPRVNATVTNTPRFAQPRREAPRGDQAYYATLPIGAAGPTLRTRPGPHVSESAKRRQKEQYRVDLEQQIREAADGRRREKQAEMNIPYSAMNGVGPGEKKMDLSVNYTGYMDPEERAAPVIPVSNRGRQPVVQPYHSKILDGLEKVDQISPRSEVVLGRRRLEDFDRLGGTGGILGAPISLSRAPTRGGGVGLLDNGFESLLEPPRISTLAPPPGLEYQPASYITQGAGGLGHSSVDEAYNFYATRNPLEDVGPAHGGDGGGGGGGVRGRPSQANQELSFAVGGGGGGGRSRVRFDDQGSRQAGQMDFPTDDDKKRQAQQKAQLYQDDLNRQIEEKRRKKILEKEEKERYERKLEREAQEYNPFGRGGGGAPMRDAHGNLITDLRLMHKDNDNPDSPRKAPQSYRSPRGPAASTVRDDLIGPPPVQTTAEGEQSHARGGHGIFGMPKTDAEKVAADRYKDDLRRQIEERKIEEMRRKEQERLEEEREQRRVEEQQRRMQAEYEEERRKIKEKEEEARRKNDELVRLAEERKREAEERRRAADERQREEERKEKEAEFNARLATEDRGKSPAVPALRNKEDKDREARGGSPPVPAARTRAADEPLPSTSKEEPVPVSRAQSADVLNQLAAMRQQLQNERQRVENMLQTEKNEPDVFDPRLVQRPPPAPVVKPEIDVFETALNRNAVAVRRTPADRANSQAMDDFTSLKHKGNTDSRKEFLRLFPDQPSSSDTLEAQQAALLRQQERNLLALRQQREYDSGYPKASVPSPSPLTQSRTPQQLHSDSAFVDVDSVNYFPDDFDDIPSNRRNESARARRRNRRDSSPRVTSQGYNDPFGSSTSLNVDRLAKKNEDRLRRLRELQGDDMSLYDPDDVLDRFMSKQAHNRPPSGQTLQDDTWMFAGAGSKASGY